MSQPRFGQSTGSSNTLRDRVSGERKGGIDPAAIAKAEAALANLSGNFAQWLNDEISKLDGARATIQTDGPTLENMESLYLRAHDLKGLGTTYGFPLVSRIAGLLCRLIEDKTQRMTAPITLVDAHILSIKAAVRDSIKSEDHPVGKILVQELEGRIISFGA